MENHEKFTRDIAGYTMNHPNLEAAYCEAMAFAKYKTPGEIALLVGPPKVGKSTLIDKTCNVLLAEGAYQKHEILRINVEPSLNGEFNWKLLYFGMLKVVNNPLAEYMLSKKPDIKVPNYDKAAPVLNMELVDDCRLRGIKLLIFENAHNLVIAGGPSLDEQLLRISSFAEQVGAGAMLATDYPALKRMDSCGRLSSRLRPIHLARYQWTDDTSRDCFLRILSKLESDVTYNGKPLSDCLDFSLADRALEIYRGTCGIIGLLKSSLTRALADAQAGLAIKAARSDKKVGTPKKVSFKAFQQHLLAGSALKSMCAELQFGENLFAAMSEIDDEVDAFLFADQAPAVAVKSKNYSQPGRRKPANDPVGLPPEFSKNGTAAA